MDLTLNNLQRLICHKTQTKPVTCWRGDEHYQVTHCLERYHEVGLLNMASSTQFQVLLFNTNNSVCTQLSGFKYYLNYLFAHS